MLHSTSGSSSRTSTPPTSTSPAVPSNSRGMRLTSVVLPAPVLPTIAVVWPGAVANEMSLSTGVLGARVVEADVAELERAVLDDVAHRVGGRNDARRRCRAPPGCGPADTDARGIIETMNVAITTDIRICTR